MLAQERSLKDQMIDIETMRIQEDVAFDIDNPFEICEFCGERIYSDDVEFVEEMKCHNYCQKQLKLEVFK